MLVMECKTIEEREREREEEEAVKELKSDSLVHLRRTTTLLHRELITNK